MQMNLFEQKPKQTNTPDYPEILDVGVYGIKWIGTDVLDPRDNDPNYFIRQFGFSCAGCGASAVNQDPLNHEDNCDSASPYIERN